MKIVWIRLLWLYEYSSAWIYAAGVALDKLKSFIAGAESSLRAENQSALYRYVQLVPIIWNKLFFATRCFSFRLVRLFLRPFRVAANFHEKITRRATSLWFDRLLDRKDTDSIIRHLISLLPKHALSSRELSGLLIMAQENNRNEIVKDCLNEMFDRFQGEIEDHNTAAVKSFLHGQYEVAEAIWSKSQQYKERQIRSLNLDCYAFRYLGPSWFLAIGHIAHLDTFFKYQILTGAPARHYLPVLPNGIQIPNQYFLDLWKPIFSPLGVNSRYEPPRLDFREVLFLQEEFWSLQTASDQSVLYSKAGALVQKIWHEQSRPPLLSLSEQDRHKGWEILRAMGLPEDGWFVSLHVRESGFHQAWHDLNPGTRNADIMTYLDAVNAITKRGGFVIRMGDSSMKPMPGLEGLVDYAHSDKKSDFMDVFLCAECQFFIGTNSGLGLVPPVFGRQCVMTNWSPIAIPQWYPGDIFIPKLVWSVVDNRFLTYEELFSTKAGWAQFQKYFAENNLQVVDNTPDEIKDVVEEMLDRVDGCSNYSEEDIVMNRTFEQLATKYAGYVGSRMGRDFLRKRRHLLQ